MRMTIHSNSKNFNVSWDFSDLSPIVLVVISLQVCLESISVAGVVPVHLPPLLAWRRVHTTAVALRPRGLLAVRRCQLAIPNTCVLGHVVSDTRESIGSAPERSNHRLGGLVVPPALGGTTPWRADDHHHQPPSAPMPTCIADKAMHVSRLPCCLHGPRWLQAYTRAATTTAEEHTERPVNTPLAHASRDGGHHACRTTRNLVLSEPLSTVPPHEGMPRTTVPRAERSGDHTTEARFFFFLGAFSLRTPLWQ